MIWHPHPSAVFITDMVSFVMELNVKGGNLFRRWR
jgi:hypothetical protein